MCLAEACESPNGDGNGGLEWGATKEAVAKEGFVWVDISKPGAKRSLFSNFNERSESVTNDRIKRTHRKYQ